MKFLRALKIYTVSVLICTISTNGKAQNQIFNLPFNPFFNKWVQEKNVKPPDFASLPSAPFIQDPLITIQDGQPHTVTYAEWPERRKEIAELVETWLLGHAPPPPGNVRAILKSTTTDMGHEVWNVQLEFGPDHCAKLNCKLYVPKGKQPVPVILYNSESYLSWTKGAMEKGFAVCIYNARDYLDESEAYKDLFGTYDWSAFRRRGWSASRVIDWLETLDFIDKTKICIGGHSRDAKQAMAGAAFDERISVIIASSPGSGGSLPFRYCDESYFGETLELTTRHFPDWVLPKARYFTGRENKLPADMHFLYALFAPRSVLMSTGINDHVESTWTVEQVYKTIKPVYSLLGAPGNIALRYRPGQHGIDEATRSAYNEFLLIATGLTSGIVDEKFPFNPYHIWDYTDWAKNYSPKIVVSEMPKYGISDPTIDRNGKKLTFERWASRREEIRKQILWLLGEGPEYKSMPVKFGIGESKETAQLHGRNWSELTTVIPCQFGTNISGNFYYPSTEPPAEGDKLPVILWLSPFNTSTGYSGGYRSPQLTLGFSKLGDPHEYTGEYQAGRIVYRNITDEGPASKRFVTFAFDHIGTGGRQEERRNFYTQYHDWSLMGKMVFDVRHAIDAVSQRPDIDPEHIYLVGYAMGGMVATLTAAIDDRVAGVVSVAGFTPFRTDTDEAGTGGVRRYSYLYGWIPRLGQFVGEEAKIPVDFNEIIACIAPRLTIVMAPKYDWHATHSDVVASVNMAHNAYKLLGSESKLKLISPNDWNRFTDEMQTQVIFMLNSYLQ